MSVGQTPEVNGVIDPAQILSARKTVEQVYLDPKLKEYIVDLVHATRAPSEYGLGDLAPYIESGASPRATIYLTRAARGQAFLNHRGYVIPEDIKNVGMDVLRHRVTPSYEAEADEIAVEDLVQKIFEGVDVP